MINRPAPAPAVLELDGFSWRDARSEDAEVLERLAAVGSNRPLFQLPMFTAEFMRAPSRPGFRQSMLCYHGEKEFGAAAYGMRNMQNLNVRLTCFFTEPARAAAALAIYVRHLFWGMPVHRIHAQLPVVDAGPAYVSLLRAVGFREEGVVRAHALMRGQSCDLAVLGVVREEFEAWCQTNERRLAI